jgi:REP element-mobilizing transposase RayT
VAPPRIEVVGQIYHANGKSIDGSKLFRDDADRSMFLRMLRKQVKLSNWCVLSYTLMPNHFHVILSLRELTLSSGFLRFNSLYARTFNRRHGRRGALWQRRFFDSMVETDEHLYEAIRYVALNAPRAQLCVDPEDWPWSSYGAAIGVAPPDPIVDEAALLEHFGTTPEQARKALRGMVEALDLRNPPRQTQA